VAAQRSARDGWLAGRRSASGINWQHFIGYTGPTQRAHHVVYLDTNNHIFDLQFPQGQPGTWTDVTAIAQ
jgi:hypothetical protein